MIRIEEIVTHLRELGNKKIDPICNEEGICYELYKRFEIKQWEMRVGKFLRPVFKHWPDYSGNPVFPIKGLYGECAEVYYLNSISLWEDDMYGDDRRRLCLWLADYLEAHPDAFDLS